MLKNALARYVALNRRIGFKFDAQARTLELFAEAMATQSIDRIDTEQVRIWAQAAASPRSRRMRYDTIRQCAVFLHAEDSRHDVPPAGAFGRGRYPRPAPHLLDSQQIAAITQAALDVQPQGTISPITYHHIIGLLAATGLRVSEVVGLKRNDLTSEGLRICDAKSGTTRTIPLHPTVTSALSDYTRQRDRIDSTSDDLFILRTGRAPTTTRVYVVFVKLARQLGFRNAEGPGPRLHDLRHSFVMRVLEAHSGDRRAMDHSIAALSAYLGHRDVASTYWYMEATPTLLTNIATASEDLFGERAP